MKIEILYDKECPFCNSYANYIKLKEQYHLKLINAREETKRVQKLKEQGFDINDGFIIQIDNKEIYQGADAVVFLNNISQKKLFFPNNKFFKTYVYSFIKMLRKFVLAIMNKEANIN